MNFKLKKPMRTLTLQPLLKLPCFFLMAGTMAMTGISGDSTASEASIPLLVAPARTSGQENKGAAPEWKGLEKVLPEVFYDGVPIIDAGEDLRKKFDGEFDVLFPKAGFEGDPWDWTQTSIFLKLKSVRASEIFNAMNLVFETAKTPLQWDLMMNGNRPTALLRNLHEPKPTDIDPATGLPTSSPPPPAEKPMVFFVGDLVGGPKSGGMTIEEVVETVSEVCKEAKIVPSALSCHKQAQLLIIRGTEEDIKFVQSTLAALRNRVELDAERQSRAKAPEPAKTKETNAP